MIIYCILYWLISLLITFLLVKYYLPPNNDKDYMVSAMLLLGSPVYVIPLLLMMFAEYVIAPILKRFM